MWANHVIPAKAGIQGRAAGLPPLAGEMSEGQRGYAAASNAQGPLYRSAGEGQGEGNQGGQTGGVRQTTNYPN